MRREKMTKEESEESDRNMSPPNLVETLNTPDPTEV
jgi:hypothetical protein